MPIKHLLISIIFVFTLNTLVYAKSTIYTFSCPEPQTISVQKGTWEGEFKFTVNGVPKKTNKVFTYKNPNKKPNHIATVYLYPESDPNSEIDCYYKTSDNEGHLSSFPFKAALKTVQLYVVNKLNLL